MDLLAEATEEHRDLRPAARVAGRRPPAVHETRRWRSAWLSLLNQIVTAVRLAPVRGEPAARRRFVAVRDFEHQTLPRNLKACDLVFDCPQRFHVISDRCGGLQAIVALSAGDHMCRARSEMLARFPINALALVATVIDALATSTPLQRGIRELGEILKTLNRFFGSAILHEITSHRIEQFKRDRLNGTWRAFKQKRAANPVKPATVDRELDTLKSILSKAVEWNYLVDSPARGVKRFRVQNRRTRILSPEEQRRLLDACVRTPKLEALLKLALITGPRIGELLALRWEDCQDGYLTFWDTKNGRVRRIPITPTIAALLASRS